MDPALPEELRLVLVLVRERVLHLFEAVVVHARRVDVHADAAGRERLRKVESHGGSSIGVL